MPPDDLTRLRHMRDAAQEALTFVRGKTSEDLARDRMLALAVVRCIEIIGEAAAKVGPQTRAAAPAIPWTAMVGMRNRLVHGYFEIDYDRVWDTVEKDLPGLLENLAGLLGPAS